MRDIIASIGAALVAVFRMTYVLVREGGRLVGRWIRALQPSSPAAPAPRSVEQMVPRATAQAARPRGDVEQRYFAVRSCAAALAIGKAPDGTMIRELDDKLQDWLALLEPGELKAVSELSPGTLQKYFAGSWTPPSRLLPPTKDAIDARRRRLAHEIGVDEIDELMRDAVVSSEIPPEYQWNSDDDDVSDERRGIKL